MRVRLSRKVVRFVNGRRHEDILGRRFLLNVLSIHLNILGYVGHVGSCGFVLVVL